MKRYFIIIVLIVALVLTSFTMVKAGAADVTLVSNSAQVKPGDTFTVALHVTSEDGINGVITTYTYDTDNLELTDHTAGNNFVDLNGDSTSNIETMISSGSKTEADVFILTFHVKESATVGSFATISTGRITLDTDASTNSETTIGEKSISVEIIGDSSESGDNGGTNDDQNGGTNTGDNGGTNDDQNGGTNTGDNGGTNDDQNGGTNTGDNGGTNDDQNGGTNTGDNGGTDDDQNGGTNTGDNGGTNNDQNSGTNTGDNGGTNNGQNTGTNAGDNGTNNGQNSGINTENNGGTNNGQNSGMNTGDNGTNSGQNSGTNTGSGSTSNSGISNSSTSKSGLTSSSTKTITTGKSTDSTIATNTIPKTGMLTITGTGIIVLGMLSIITFIKLKQYKDI